MKTLMMFLMIIAVATLMFSYNLLSEAFISKQLRPYSNCEAAMTQLVALKSGGDPHISPHGAGKTIQTVWTQVSFSVEFEKDLVPHKMRCLKEIGLDMSHVVISIHHQDPNATEALNDVINTVSSFGVPQTQIYSCPAPVSGSQ